MKEMWTMIGLLVISLLAMGIIYSGCRFIHTVWKASNKILTHHMVLQLNKGASLIYKDSSNSSNKEAK